MPRPYSENLRWRAIWMKEILGYQADEVAAASRMASLGFRPHGHFIYFYLFIYLIQYLCGVSSVPFNCTRKHQ